MKVFCFEKIAATDPEKQYCPLLILSWKMTRLLLPSILRSLSSAAQKCNLYSGEKLYALSGCGSGLEEFICFQRGL